MANTGNVVYQTLEEYYVNGPNAGQATGNTKPNDSSDPDYVAPEPYDSSNPNHVDSSGNPLGCIINTVSGFTLEEYDPNATDPYKVTFAQTGYDSGGNGNAKLLYLLDNQTGSAGSGFSVTISDEDENGNAVGAPAWLSFTLGTDGSGKQRISIKPNSNNDTGAARFAYKRVKDDNTSYDELVTVEQSSNGGTGIL